MVRTYLKANAGFSLMVLFVADKKPKVFSLCLSAFVANNFCEAKTKNLAVKIDTAKPKVLNLPP
jgi:hypothetical protein